VLTARTNSVFGWLQLSLLQLAIDFARSTWKWVGLTRGEDQIDRKTVQKTKCDWIEVTDRIDIGKYPGSWIGVAAASAAHGVRFDRARAY
jgi:hypothetical protein